MSAISAGRVSPCVVDGVQDLARATADVDGVQHGPHHRHAKEALQVAVGLVRDVGFDPVEVGKLADANRFQRGAPGDGQNVSAAELRQKLSLAP